VVLVATRDKQQAVGTPAVVEVGEARPTRAPTWLVVLTVILGLMVVALGAWLFVDRLSQPEEVGAAEATQWIDAG